MKIGESSIDSDTTYFIAEAGVNHNGDMDLARELIDAAVSAGADAVKFQTFRAERLVTESATKATYQTEQTNASESQFDMLRRYELSKADHEELMAYADEQEITFLSTPFDRQSADLLDEYDLPAIKLGSGELDNIPLLQHVAQLGRPMIVSTGMSTLDEVKRADRAIREANPDVSVGYMHCVSSYPTDPADVNLRAMDVMRQVVSGPVGFSDHTTAPETPALAVAAGAQFVEKHFTLDKSMEGPDHAASLEPDELKRAVSLVRLATTARGDPEKRPTSDEDNKTTIRKSLHANTDLKEGDVLTEESVKIVRPADGLPPERLESVLGKRLAVSVTADDPLVESVFGDNDE
ncbi:N-acetylneuraminate synthase [Haloferax namakaokahaiae]|uniref:N-acetylneuraminate synthase n=1 Tax=Haloferax namakaokahaiae TaxID=1748331 RepID=A0ABD5ZED3_9EURY